MDFIFAIAFVPDKILDILPVPYLLQQDDDGNYLIHKRLTSHDLQLDIVIEYNWIHKIIELAETLIPNNLNKKINKKHHKISFFEFIKNTDDKTMLYLKGFVDNKKVEIINIVKENKIAMFVKPEQVDIVYQKDVFYPSDEHAHVSFEFEKKAATLHYRLKFSINEKRSTSLMKKLSY